MFVIFVMAIMFFLCLKKALWCSLKTLNPQAGSFTGWLLKQKEDCQVHCCLKKVWQLNCHQAKIRRQLTFYLSSNKLPTRPCLFIELFLFDVPLPIGFCLQIFTIYFVLAFRGYTNKNCRYYHQANNVGFLSLPYGTYRIHLSSLGQTHLKVLSGDKGIFIIVDLCMTNCK